MMPKNAIVVGMARSGTSLTASIFVKKGYFVADNPSEQLQSASRHNPGGFWELEELKDASANIFARVGFPHHNTWTSNPIEPHQAEAINSLEILDEHKELAKYYEDKQPWIWKDPRFPYTLGYWWQLMNRENTGVVLITRDPNEIRRSLLRTNWGNAASGDKREFIKRIEDHIVFARRTIEQFDIPHIEIDYSDYAARPKETAAKLGHFFGLEISPDDVGYNSSYNTSTPRGKVEFMTERLARTLPPSLRRAFRNALPDYVKRVLLSRRSE